MALEGEEVGLENLFVDTSDTTVTFPNCPDVATENKRIALRPDQETEWKSI